jgi:hypothetical protein
MDWGAEVALDQQPTAFLGHPSNTPSPVHVPPSGSQHPSPHEVSAPLDPKLVISAMTSVQRASGAQPGPVSAAERGNLQEVLPTSDTQLGHATKAEPNVFRDAPPVSGTQLSHHSEAEGNKLRGARPVAETQLAPVSDN